MNIPNSFPQSKSDQDITLSDDGNAAAWVDSDDQRIVVSLASNPRLPKLRNTESEDLVDGKEYSERVRRQFERLYPLPDWACSHATTKASPKERRKLSIASEGSEADASADDMSHQSDDLSTQPLAKLLKNADRLTQPITTSSNIHRQLPPEVIDIHRTKDVCTAQPVSFVSSFSSFLSLLTPLVPSPP